MTHSKSKQKRAVDRVVTSGLTLALMFGVWAIFFWLHRQSGLGDPDFMFLVFGLIRLYVILEIFIVIGEFIIGNSKEDNSQSELILKLIELSKSIDSKSHTIDRVKTTEVGSGNHD